MRGAHQLGFPEPEEAVREVWVSIKRMRPRHHSVLLEDPEFRILLQERL
jgi:hypothetical protein